MAYRDGENILKTLLYAGIFALLVGALVALTGCGGIPIPDNTLTPCQRAKVERLIACQTAGPRCGSAIEVEAQACGSTTEPPPNPDPPDEPEPEPVCAVGQTCGCWHRPPTKPWEKLADCPVPDPEPEPDPEPQSGDWKDSDGTEECVALNAGGKYLLEVQGALQRALDAQAITDPWVKGEEALYTALVPFLKQHGLQAALLTEELAVQRGEGFSENYDTLRSNGRLILSGAGLYKSTCKPALRTKALAEAAPPGDPNRWPKPISEVRIKVHVPAANRSDGRAVIDGVALHCGTSDSAFPGRNCYPACGPEDFAGREQCDRNNPPDWSGGDEHPSNPWLRFARPGTSVVACIRGITCSAVLVVP